MHPPQYTTQRCQVHATTHDPCRMHIYIVCTRTALRALFSNLAQYVYRYTYEYIDNVHIAKKKHQKHCTTRIWLRGDFATKCVATSCGGVAHVRSFIKKSTYMRSALRWHMRIVRARCDPAREENPYNNRRVN